jgi:hypothetical protein
MACDQEVGGNGEVALRGVPPPTAAIDVAIAATALPVLRGGDLGDLPKLEERFGGARLPKLSRLVFPNESELGFCCAVSVSFLFILLLLLFGNSLAAACSACLSKLGRLSVLSLLPLFNERDLKRPSDPITLLMSVSLILRVPQVADREAVSMFSARCRNRMIAALEVSGCIFVSVIPVS